MPKTKRTVKQRIPVADDLEIHVSSLIVANEPFVEIRNYIPSLKEYGRGITYPQGVNGGVARGLAAVAPLG